MHHELTWGLRLDPQKRNSIDTEHLTCTICHYLQKIMSEWNWITEHPLAVPEELIEFLLVRKNIPFHCRYRSDLVMGSKKKLSGLFSTTVQLCCSYVVPSQQIE